MAVGISHVIVLRDLHLQKHLIPKLVTEEGMSMEVRAEQPEKHKSPRLVTEEGMVMEVRAEQPEKQKSPRLVTEEGMSMEVRDEPEKQPSPRLVTEEGITVLAHPKIMLLVEVSIIALQFFRESYTGLFSSTMMEVRDEQLPKHHSPKLVTEEGMVMEVRDEPEKQ